MRHTAAWHTTWGRRYVAQAPGTRLLRTTETPVCVWGREAHGRYVINWPEVRAVLPDHHSTTRAHGIIHVSSTAGDLDTEPSVRHLKGSSSLL